jgi:hypothetical protein
MVIKLGKYYLQKPKKGFIHSGVVIDKFQIIYPNVKTMIGSPISFEEYV